MVLIVLCVSALTYTIPHYSTSSVFEFPCVPEFLSFLSVSVFFGSLASFLSALLSPSLYPYLSYLISSCLLVVIHLSICVAAFICLCSLPIFLCPHLSVPICLHLLPPLTFTFFVSVSAFLSHIHTFVGFLAPLSLLDFRLSLSPFFYLCYHLVGSLSSCACLLSPSLCPSVFHLFAILSPAPSLCLYLYD